ncbi:hypothetical protein [Rhizobium miluonense]|uniref:Uncharacterized protein n=1 Tax=Rhizobium miluonense TaxID=411945 RepID=A0A1C3WNZ2_9HYPH|nr:hypothetical protein [Rhizobium miluonense]SCB41645.1 hypothetical protein GA0061102_103474 [Rhizobium miluonense]
MKLGIEVIGNTVDTLQSISQMISSTAELEDVSALKKKLGEMSSLVLAAHGKAVAAQVEVMKMMLENFDLHAQLMQVDRWEGVAARYRLKDFGGQTFAYELKPEYAVSEPAHTICPHCFENQRKSLLQFLYETATLQRVFKCGGCSQEITLGLQSVSRPDSSNSYTPEFY